MNSWERAIDSFCLKVVIFFIKKMNRIYKSTYYVSSILSRGGYFLISSQAKWLEKKLHFGTLAKQPGWKYLSPAMYYDSIVGMLNSPYLVVSSN